MTDCALAERVFVMDMTPTELGTIEKDCLLASMVMRPLDRVFEANSVACFPLFTSLARIQAVGLDFVATTGLFFALTSFLTGNVLSALMVLTVDIGAVSSFLVTAVGVPELPKKDCNN